MSKRASPPLLGAFIIGGMLLIAIGLIVVGARGLFASKSRLILFFPGSVNGLQVGSAVKFKGVTIGQVSAIKISVATGEAPGTIPVIVEVDNGVVADTTGHPLDLSNRALVKALVTRGLRGSLEIESFLTGILYVGLNMYRNAPPAVYSPGKVDYPEIPTVQTGLQKLAGSLPKIERILDRVEGVAAELEEKLRQVNASQINESLIASLGDLQRILRSPTITNTFVSVENMANEFRLAAADLRTEIKPLADKLGEVSAAADKTLVGADRTLADVQQLLGNDSPLVGQLISTLSEFEQTAVALRQLADFLARNPNAILTGRDLSKDHTP